MEMTEKVYVRERVMKNGDKKYEYRFEIASGMGKRKWITKCGFFSYQEAMKAGISALDEYNGCGIVIKPNEMSFSAFLDEWMEKDCRATLKEVTVYNYQKKVKNLIKPYLGEYRLKTITRDNLQSLLNELYDMGYAKNTLNGVKGIISKSFDYAERMGYIKLSPAGKLKIPKTELTTIPTRTAPHSYIPAEKMMRVFERFPEGSSSYIPLLIGYHCGLRIGEIFGLLWEDIDFNKGTLTVNRQMQWKQLERTKEEKKATNGCSPDDAGYWYFSSPKFNSNRCIELDDMLLDVLKRERQRQFNARQYFGADIPDITQTPVKE